MTIIAGQTLVDIFKNLKTEIETEIQLATNDEVGAMKDSNLLTCLPGSAWVDSGSRTSEPSIPVAQDPEGPQPRSAIHVRALSEPEELWVAAAKQPLFEDVQASDDPHPPLLQPQLLAAILIFYEEKQLFYGLHCVAFAAYFGLP